MARALKEVSHQLLRSAVAAARGLVIVGGNEILDAALTAVPTPQPINNALPDTCFCVGWRADANRDARLLRPAISLKGSVTRLDSTRLLSCKLRQHAFQRSACS